jgi:micrococcal nuclease
MRIPRLCALAGALSVAIVLAPAVASAGSAPPRAHATALCADYATQAQAQRAADTRDGDGDGIYCEDLPCPCSTGLDGGGSGGGESRRVKQAQAISARIISVVDGDTIKVRAFAAKRRFYTVRLIGIDTPETKRPSTPVQCGGKRATDSMFELAFAAPQDTDGDGLLDDDDGSRGRRVTLRTDPSQDTFDHYGRLLAYVTTDRGVNLGARQITRGWAAVYVYGGVPFRQVERFQRAQRRARSESRGVWARCRGDFHWPA